MRTGPGRSGAAGGSAQACPACQGLSLWESWPQSGLRGYSLPKNFVERVDKPGRVGYYVCNITKMAVKRRVGFRIDPSREPGRWKRAGNRELKMVSEPRGRSARVLSPRRERPLQRPAVSSGRRKPLPQHRGRAREGAVNQGGTTEVLCAFVLVGSCPPRTEALFSCFRLHKAQKMCCAVQKIYGTTREGKHYV